jgi:hypothetical protein
MRSCRRIGVPYADAVEQDRGVWCVCMLGTLVTRRHTKHNVRMPHTD